MEEQWRWLLVDALAHGRRWYNPTHASIVQKPEYTALYEQYEEEPNLRTKLALAKILTEKLGRNIEAMYRSFNRSESARILTTPRFDIMDSFMKADIPDSQDEYFPKLPSLAIPFQEFWVEWRWIGEDHDAHFCCRVIADEPLEDGTIRLIMTAFTWMPHKANDDSACLKNDATAYLSADRKIERLVVGGNTHLKHEENLFFPCIHALALLGCKNVTTQEVRAPRQLRRDVQRTLGVALCSYRVVTIAPTRKMGRLMEASKVPGVSRAMSICRGHFKTYDDGGLFGYKKGTWWWADHVRGEYERGVIVKDYALKGTHVENKENIVLDEVTEQM